MKGRLFIYPKDIVILTGKQYLAAWRSWNSILAAYGKTKQQGLTIKDYCLYCGLDESEVRASIL